VPGIVTTRTSPATSTATFFPLTRSSSFIAELSDNGTSILDFR
jgi:hypothetical protein